MFYYQKIQITLEEKLLENLEKQLFLRIFFFLVFSNWKQLKSEWNLALTMR